MLGIHLTSRDRKHIHEILKTYQAQKEVQSMQKFIQHGHTSTYQHSMNVVRLSYWLNKHFHLHADEKALLVGALLHDFYLYDWHEKNREHSLHGFKHPYFAFRNADRDFKLNDIEKNVILRHMFPLTPIPPACREAWIVCMADKYCSARETMYTVKRYAHNARQLVFG